MKKIFITLFTAILVSPLATSAAAISSDGITVTGDNYLINFSVADDSVFGQYWTGNGWSDEEEIFAIPDDYNNVSSTFTLTNGTYGRLLYGYLVTYSPTDGFNPEEFPTDFAHVSDTIVNDNSVTFIDCYNTFEDQAYGLTWNQVSGFGETTLLSNSQCGEDLSYFIGQKNVVLDFYSGNAYDPQNGFAVLDSIDLSEMPFPYNDNDFDSQGHGPQLAFKKNGDVAFIFDTLFGYAYADKTWQPIVSMDDGFHVLQEEPGHFEDEFIVGQTGNNKNIFAFATNTEKTEYRFYRWTSATGWALDKTYTFDDSTDLILSNINNNQKKFYWAFWTNETNQLNIYRWTEDNYYELLTTRDLDCNAQCGFTLDVSKKGKVFFVWVNQPAAYAAAWKPDTEAWEDYTLVDTTGDASLSNTYVTPKGQWVVEYFDNKKRYAIRWTPDSGWGMAQHIVADDTYFNGNKYYLVDLASNHELTVSRWQWREATAKLITTINEISSLRNYKTFVCDDRLFLAYITQDNERLLDDIEL